ncbi:hypothetical protein CK203_000026 [Vitis vinifera]|uniref:Uncharacterized protein n=1 Tax=Vitis vinifera TaxID=29760 RepID=A0A438KRC1_VITVI|nr:hypothetical protein CK203_000026 [Vitis vinifera]
MGNWVSFFPAQRMLGQVVRARPFEASKCHQKLYHDVVDRHFNLLELEGFEYCGNYPGSIEGNDTWTDMWTNTWRGVPTMPPLTRVPKFEQRWTGHMSLQITPPFMGHMSFGDSMRVSFIEVTVRQCVTLSGPSKGTHKHFVLQLLLWYDRGNLWLGLALQAGLGLTQPRALVCQTERPTELLFEQEFWESFRIPNDVFILLVDDDPTLIEKQSHNAIYFTKEQFNVLMGCNILDMLFHLDLSLLEVSFVYTIKRAENEYSSCPLIPSLQLVTGLSDSNKGGARGHILVLGPWVGLLESPNREFHPHRSLQIPGKKRRDRNLLTVVRESWLYILPILPSFVPKVLVPGEHDLLKDLPFYEVAHVVDPKARQDRLDQREKKREDGMLRQVPCGNPPSASSSMTITKQDSAANTPSMGMKLETKIEPMMPASSMSRSSFRQEILHGGTPLGAHSEHSTDAKALG